MKRITVLLVLTYVFIGISFAGQAEDNSKGFAESIFGTWTCWNVQTHRPNEKGLLSIRFFRNKKAEWTTSVDGKTVTRTGTYDIEASENLFHPTLGTHIIRLHRAPLPKGDPASSVLKTAGEPIHLINVRVAEDNRFLSGTRVLKFRDAFYSEFVCQKKGTGQQKNAPDKK